MMNSLFSSFDPSSSIMKTNYFVLMLIITIPSLSMLFTLNSRLMNIMMTISFFMEKELKATLNNSNTSGKLKILISIFIMILILNLLGLMPYVFTFTAHMSFTLGLALPFWLGFLLFTMINNTNHFLSHLVPLSTPLPLSQFMTLIETVSQIIRPITLSVRLAANMTAGHILMALVSAPIFMMNQFSLILSLLLLLEVAVAFIQSYVFTVLLTMYLSETY